MAAKKLTYGMHAGHLPLRIIKKLGAATYGSYSAAIGAVAGILIVDYALTLFSVAR